MVRTLIHDVEHLVTGFGTDPAGELGMMYLYMTLNSRYFAGARGRDELQPRLSLEHVDDADGPYYPGVTLAFLEAMKAGPM
ncbi:MAG: hypothetical protein R3E53_08970 [Myxococcota bacterium]